MQGATWFDALPLAEIAMNNAPLPQSHMTAFFLNYGFHPNFDADVFSEHNQHDNLLEDPNQFVTRLHAN